MRKFLFSKISLLVYCHQSTCGCLYTNFKLTLFYSFPYFILFLVVPPVNYIRALLAIRSHNAQLGDAVTLQMSIVLQREKRVALDMCIVAGLRIASLPPAFCMSIVQKRYPRLHSVLLPWSLTMSFIPSCANPVIYFVRFKNMRNTFKSIINI